jgi:uncharacterized coiled-coil protein SlyX
MKKSELYEKVAEMEKTLAIKESQIATLIKALSTWEKCYDDLKEQMEKECKENNNA